MRELGNPLEPDARETALTNGRELVRAARARASERTPLDAFLQEFGLSNPEGIALMCLAEALLRIPDDATADRLIAEKLGEGDWERHAGRSESLFVNASTWALMLTGRFVELPGTLRGNAGEWLRGLSRRLGEPVVRAALRRGMQIIGAEFVVGRTIGEALARCEREPALAWCSFDMLGEAARTVTQARHYEKGYAQAIEAIARSAASERHSISIKLSALDPRYSLAQQERVHERLVPRALALARLAARHGLALTIDAEEADRLEISLQVVAALARDPVTKGWEGLGLAVQAYGKRAPAVIDWVQGLARETKRRMGVRIVKGAYWDGEIKRAQERGLTGYPVFTRKASTDLSWLACARRLFAAGTQLYPQFATHNAHSIAAVMAMRPAGHPCEFQRLHGMGTLLYDCAQRLFDSLPPVRVYAPVGAHEDLLAYLVRRLLENGANTSFVNRFMDEDVPVGQVVTDPADVLARVESIAHPGLPLPRELYGRWRNSNGEDFGLASTLGSLQRDVAAPPAPSAPAGAAVNGDEVEITNPADRREVVSRLRLATREDVTLAMQRAQAVQREWNERGGDARAAVLERAGDAIERERDRLLALLVREAGRTIADAVSEVREAADYCRYYASEARRLFGRPLTLPGPTGETNVLTLEGRGVIACISPWNFPLAIFTGQVAAARLAGNTVLAKPAEATPLVAHAAVQLLHEAGVPEDALHVLPMNGREFGETALADPRLAGVVFTGSTATGQWLNRALARREGPIQPLIAETGGQNAMIVDSTALAEQVIDDVIASAFGSAGQRCSALRVLCLQDDIADRMLDMLAGAMQELVVGDPALVATDVGPLISVAAVRGLQEYVNSLPASVRRLHAGTLGESHQYGSFMAPHLLEIPDLSVLRGEQFGPILHVLRYRLEDRVTLLEALRAGGYALTMGVHSRLESTWKEAFAATQTGNVYVNRTMIGAVVGVQPFGGSGLSGTGPKAGGPHYLPRLAIERTLTVNVTATGGNAALLQLQ